MKKFLCIVGTVMLMMNAYGQNLSDRFYVGERLADIPLSRITNYKDSVTKLSTFGDKLIIFDFWSIHCSPCVATFPKIDSIQKELKDKVQFVLITGDPKEKVEQFLKKWNKSHITKLSVPVIYGERALEELFIHRANPHMVFIRSDGFILTQTSDEMFLDKNLIASMASRAKTLIETIKNYGLSESAYKMREPNPALLKRLHENKWIDFELIYL